MKDPEYYQRLEAYKRQQELKEWRDYCASLTPKQKEQEQKEWLKFLFTWENIPEKKEPKKKKKTPDKHPEAMKILKYMTKSKSFIDYIEIAMDCGGYHSEETRLLCDRLVTEGKLIKSDLDERQYKINL